MLKRPFATADQRKDEFLALLAHELRNPLAPIRYALAGDKKGGRTAEQQRRAEEIIDRQVVHMSRLLDDLLDISRITRGKFELKKQSDRTDAGGRQRDRDCKAHYRRKTIILSRSICPRSPCGLRQTPCAWRRHFPTF